MLKIIVANVNVFVLGIKDSLSYHKSLIILINCPAVAQTICLVFSANLGLVIGSVILYSKGITPLLHHIFKDIDPELDNLSNYIVFLFYHANWLVPIYLLCYVISSFWYQEIADSSFRYLKGVPKETSVSKSLSEGFYSTLIWFILFVQLQILNFTPDILLSWTKKYLDFTSTSTNIYNLFLILLIYFVITCLKLSSAILMGILYGWYSFDPFWIASGFPPNTRFSIVENHWAYFLGFGFPYMILLKTASFFIGYGLFLTLFPFCILLGGLSDYNAAYEMQELKPPPLYLFNTPKIYSLKVLQFLDRIMGKKGYLKMAEKKKR